MNAAALVIVLVGAGEAGSDWAAGTLQALREGLDRRVLIELREANEAPAGTDAHVVSVVLTQGGRRATLERLGPARASSKDLVFKKSDRAIDRGRAIGYALAALVPELRADAPAPVEPPPPPPPPAVTPEPPVVAPEPPQQATVASPVEPAAPPGRVAFEASAGLASSFVSSEPGFDASLTVELRLIDALMVRAGGEARFGNSPLPGAALRQWVGRLGLRARFFSRSVWAVSAIAQGLLLHLELSTRGETQTRWQGAAELGVELALEASRLVTLVLSPIASTSFAATQIYVDGQRVAAITPFYFALRLGIRLWP